MNWQPLVNFTRGGYHASPEKRKSGCEAIRVAQLFLFHSALVLTLDLRVVVAESRFHSIPPGPALMAVQYVPLSAAVSCDIFSSCGDPVVRLFVFLTQVSLPKSGSTGRTCGWPFHSGGQSAIQREWQRVAVYRHR